MTVVLTICGIAFLFCLIIMGAFLEGVNVFSLIATAMRKWANTIRYAGKPLNEWMSVNLREEILWDYTSHQEHPGSPTSLAWDEWVFQHVHTGMRIEWNSQTEEARVIHPFNLKLPKRHRKHLRKIALKCVERPYSFRASASQQEDRGLREMLFAQYRKIARTNALPEGGDYCWVRDGNQYVVYHRRFRKIADEPALPVVTTTEVTTTEVTTTEVTTTEVTTTEVATIITEIPPSLPAEPARSSEGKREKEEMPVPPQVIQSGFKRDLPFRELEF